MCKPEMESRTALRRVASSSLSSILKSDFSTSSPLWERHRHKRAEAETQAEVQAGARSCKTMRMGPPKQAELNQQQPPPPPPSLPSFHPLPRSRPRLHGSNGSDLQNTRSIALYQLLDDRCCSVAQQRVLAQQPLLSACGGNTKKGQGRGRKKNGEVKREGNGR